MLRPSGASFPAVGLHFLSIPFNEEFLDVYAPSEFTNKDYPNLIPPDQRVETIVVGNLLAVFNWPENSERYRKVARFTEAFSRAFPSCKSPDFIPSGKA